MGDEDDTEIKMEDEDDTVTIEQEFGPESRYLHE